MNSRDRERGVEFNPAAFTVPLLKQKMERGSIFFIYTSNDYLESTIIIWEENIKSSRKSSIYFEIGLKLPK